MAFNGSSAINDVHHLEGGGDQCVWTVMLKSNTFNGYGQRERAPPRVRNRGKILDVVYGRPPGMTHVPEAFPIVLVANIVV